MKPIIEAIDICKDFQLGHERIKAVDHVSLTVQKGEFVVITGESGSGKSTLLQILGLVDLPSRGKLLFDSKEVGHLKDNDLSDMRLYHVGFIHQFFHLVPSLTALENVALPLFVQKKPKREAYEKAAEILALVGLKDRGDHYPNQLSGGQMQRVAIARAVVTEPQIILADEPTGNLDSKTSEEILDLLSNINKTKKIAFVMVTHSDLAAKRGSRLIQMKDGQLIEKRVERKDSSLATTQGTP